MHTYLTPCAGEGLEHFLELAYWNVNTRASWGQKGQASSPFWKRSFGSTICTLNLYWPPAQLEFLIFLKTCPSEFGKADQSLQFFLSFAEQTSLSTPSSTNFHSTVDPSTPAHSQALCEIRSHRNILHIPNPAVQTTNPTPLTPYESTQRLGAPSLPKSTFSRSQSRFCKPGNPLSKHSVHPPLTSFQVMLTGSSPTYLKIPILL